MEFLKELRRQSLASYITGELPSLMSLNVPPPVNFTHPTDPTTTVHGLDECDSSTQFAPTNFLAPSNSTTHSAESTANAEEAIHSPRGTLSPHADDQADFKEFAEHLYATLVGRPEGYNSIQHLLNDFEYVKEKRVWAGTDGEAKARSFGYKCFIDFLRSSAMLDLVVIVEDPDLGVVYKPRRRAEIAHIQQAQATSAEHVMRKRVRNAVNKEVGGVKNENTRLRAALKAEKKKVGELTTNVSDLVEQKKREIEELEKQVVCQLCMARNNNVVFNCGHVACRICAQKLEKCHMQCPGAFAHRSLYL